MNDTGNNAALTAEMMRGYARKLGIAIVSITLLWHLVGAGQLLQRHLSAYRPPGLHLAGWLALLLVMGLASAALLTGRTTTVTTWSVAMTALVLLTVVTALLPTHRLLETDWAWGSVGWTGVVALLYRPLRELVVFMAAAAAITFGFLCLEGLSRPELTAFIVVLYGGTSLQLAVVFTARALSVPARNAAQAALAEAEAVTQRVISEQLHTLRLERYNELRTAVEPLLRGLADGTVSPEDPAVRRQCLASAARLRRMLAERDSTTDPLLHDLQVCAEEVARHGVLVDLEAIGEPPSLPPAIRRELVDPVVEVLARAGTSARITLIGEPGGVTIGVVSDSTADLNMPGPHNVDTVWQRDGTELWMETRWQNL
ncbi:hypothetical protein ACQP2K_03220 [Microbispora siamensis]